MPAYDPYVYSHVISYAVFSFYTDQQVVTKRSRHAGYDTDWRLFDEKAEPTPVEVTPMPVA